MERDIQLIAETDQDGRVICVWQHGASDRFPHPLNSSDFNLLTEARTSFHGASPDAITGWLKRQHARNSARLSS